MKAHWFDRLEEARRHSFVGRESETGFLRQLLAADRQPILALYYYGPGGIGKTTLLRELAHLARERGAGAYYLDGRAVEASPPSFEDALRALLTTKSAESPAAFLAEQTARQIVLIDTYERLRPLDAWLRETWFPQLHENTLVILAGRDAPAQGWRQDPGWQSLMRVVPLQNLSESESKTYLSRRAIPPEEHEAVLKFTHGHPLALSLVADTFAQRGQPAFSTVDATDVIRLLVERLVDQTPGPHYRAALEASAMVRLTNESILAAMLDLEDVHDIFAWLRELSFMDAAPDGIFPHDLARDALTGDLRWRNPERYASLHDRARGHYASLLPHLDGRRQRHLLSDYIFLHRDNPIVRPFFDWHITGQVFTDVMERGDISPLVAMIRRHEGDQSAAVAAHWLPHTLSRVSVLRDGSSTPAGVLLLLPVEKTTAADREFDPALPPIWRFLQQQPPLRSGESAILFRYWLAADTYQSVSSTQSRIFLNMVQCYLNTPGLAFTFLPCADPDFWQPAFAYGDLRRVPALDFAVGEREYGVYMRDWRTSPPLVWLTLMGEREMAAELSQPSEDTRPVVVLDETTFAESVRDALRSLNDPFSLEQNALAQTGLVRQSGSRESPGETIRMLLLQAIDALQHTPRQRKMHRALLHTYVQPAPTQEQAAELLDIPFSTYRRHLSQGMARVTATLWQQELGRH